MIAVIVLNWNNAPDTLECLESIYRSDYPNYTVYLVDNGSSDGSAELLPTAYPQACFIQNGANLGFAEGNNRGIQKALDDGAEYIFLLNNDAIIRNDTLSLLASSARNHPEAGAIGPKIYFYDWPTHIWYAGAEVCQKSGQFHHRDRMMLESEAPKRSVEATEYVCGCAFFARADAIRKVGLMDPRFFLNWEEIDWCCRFQKLGYQTLYDPTPKVWHKIGASFVGGKRGAMWRYYYWRNRFLWLEKNVPLSKRLAMVYRYILPEIKQLIQNTRQPESRAESLASLCGIFHYCLRKFGQGPSFLAKK